jgi:hypothetical protein
MKKKGKASDAESNRKRNDELNKTENTDAKKLPGEYPPQEDIMNRRDTERIPIDEQNFSRQIGQENMNRPGERLISNPNDIQEEPPLGNPGDLEEPSAREMERPVPKHLFDEDDMDFSEESESDVTKEDLQALGPKDLSLDMGEDEVLKNRVWPVDMAGEDLDVPGTELDDPNEAIGSEDEENNPYSIGGDRNEDQLEGK